MPASQTPRLHSIPARWVLYRARRYRRAVDARGLPAVVVRLARQGFAWAALAMAALGGTAVVFMQWAMPALGAPATLTLALGLVPVLAAGPVGRWVARTTGWVCVDPSSRKQATHALETLGLPARPADRSLTSLACDWLWMVEILHLLVDPQGQARMAARDLGVGIPAPDPSADLPVDRARF